MKNRARPFRRSQQLAIVGVLLSVLVQPSTSGAGNPPAAARHLRAPAHVRYDTQAELAARMGSHGQVMENLVRAVVLLDRPTIRQLAGRIADEEVVVHAGRSVHEPLPLALPREFFLEQTKLVVAARDLAAAAGKDDDRVLADRFAAMTGACVACHSAYLRGRPDQEPDPFGGKRGATQDQQSPQGEPRH